VLLNYVQAMLKAGTAGKKNGEDTIETVHHLLESRKDGNCTKVAEILITAAAKGDTDMLNLLLHYGANKNRVRADGSTPLLIAAEKGHVQIVSMLLEAGACRETAANDGYTPLAISAMNGHDRTTRLLLEAGADRSKARADGYTPLMIAALGGRGEIAKDLLRYRGQGYCSLGVVVGLGVVRERTGQAAGLLSLSKFTMLVVFGFLYEKGAAVNHVANNGDNALMCASRRGNAEIVKYLVDAGADPDSRKKSAACHVESGVEKSWGPWGRNLNGETALMCASRHGNARIVECLITAGADPNIQDSNGETALHFARIRRHVKCATLLSHAKRIRRHDPFKPC